MLIKDFCEEFKVIMEDVPFVMEEDVALHLVNVGFLCAIGIIFQADGIANLV